MIEKEFMEQVRVWQEYGFNLRMRLNGIPPCDLCSMDGDIGHACAKYRDLEGKIWRVCSKHLRCVIKAKLEYWDL